jgi:hypothetical protein
MKRYATREDLGLTRTEFHRLALLDTPEKIQDFLTYEVKQNFEIGGETVLSVREVLRQRRAHCIEGAMLAACALWVHGEPPLLLDLQAVHDFDHVVALFRRNGRWGAISKTNGIGLRWRDPIYRSLRELAVSYAHEYCNKRGQKTLRRYSVAFDLRRVDPEMWVTNGKHCWDLANMLLDIRHYSLMSWRQEKSLRLRDKTEKLANALVQYPRPALKR